MQFILEHKRIWIRWLPAIFFAVAIFLFSSIPGQEVEASLGNVMAAVKTISPPPVNSKTSMSFPQIEWPKVGHGIGYFCLGFTMLYALTPRARRASFIALIVCSLYAITDELHQAMIPGRSASSRDVLLDSLASLAGILILFGIMKWIDCKNNARTLSVNS